MNKDQRKYVLEQLDKMSEELESIEDVAKRAEVRGKYIELFIDMCTVSNIAGPVEEDLVEEEEPIVEDEPEVEDEVIEEPESVTAETEAVVDNVKNADDIFDEDAEEVRVVLNENEEEVDITEIYNKLRADGLDEETADCIGLFLVETEAVEAYDKYNYMAAGFPRMYAAYMSTALTDQQLLAYIIEFSGLEVGALEKPSDFIDEENAEAIYDFIFQ